MPQLDSVRALAFFAVALSHWLPIKWLASLGGPGVQLFFVLSGFLITGILLDYRRTQENNPSLSVASALRTFYARRFLRIFPLFYFVIAVTALLNIYPVRERWPWHVAYASNYLYAVNSPGGDPFSHFWSLAVEEQFYLIWPFVVFALPLRSLKQIIVGLVVFAPLFRIVAESALPHWHRVNYLPPSCGDSLGIGALLAFALRNPELFKVPVTKMAHGIGAFGMLGGILTAIAMVLTERTFVLDTLGHTFLVLVFGWFIFGAARGFGGILGQLMNRSELRFLGKISYGLYVFHNLFTRLDLHPLFGRLHLPTHWADYMVVDLLTRFTLTLLVATGSWYLLEKPLNELKRKFTLKKKLAEAGVPESLQLAPGA